MLDPNREWQRRSGASATAIATLREAAPIALPDSYYELLAYSDGGEGPLSKQPFYFQLDAADVALAAFARGLDDEFFPGFLMIGSNGGGEYIAFDVRASAPWPVVALDMTNIDLSESVMPIADSFDAFIALIGMEAEGQ